ncbi:trypsin-1-like isoform X2 [Dinothrombium tinctorium]|uniref:Trypsin-1-like isoform X2 n=1 Tax=Dinothrombium tinctorium TaxID=1965070 RepID=A0A3S4QHX9_9ACAR|nr:trypsin-1-like isoform X2 [Dinothrombium tinctorium]RWS02992.1 trypsin-1-like isoform X2 [Dinothrombium tinctorium]RWS03598.1 trypsin-1-like isoform X2 [Dinothrombium tinctorium]RWS03720.1 trypsin-1-like isoform X2 [Dinothrombium tinctorium]
MENVYRLIFTVRERLQVLAGTHYWNNADRVGSLHTVTGRVPHPAFRISGFVGDIALIKVSPPFRYTRGTSTGRGAIGPVCLPRRRRVFRVSSGIVSGVGTVREDGPVSSFLKSRAYPSRPYFESSSMICAGNLRSSIGTCYLYEAI